jgi:hypothetical protein
MMELWILLFSERRLSAHFADVIWEYVHETFPTKQQFCQNYWHHIHVNTLKHLLGSFIKCWVYKTNIQKL